MKRKMIDKGLKGRTFEALPLVSLEDRGQADSLSVEIAALLGATAEALEKERLASIKEALAGQQFGTEGYRGDAFRLTGRAVARHRDDAGRLLEQVGLRTDADRPCAQLAYGDLKRLELALALANEPRLLLMDEPTAGMAPAERHDLMGLVTRLVAALGVAVLFTEHDMDIVFGHADRLLVLDRGRLVAQGEPAAVRADPEVRRIYLGDDPGGGS
jgi:ABC-type branched-subunit amino acid transport system ATPase component